MVSIRINLVINGLTYPFKGKKFIEEDTSKNSSIPERVRKAPSNHLSSSDADSLVKICLHVIKKIIDGHRENATLVTKYEQPHSNCVSPPSNLEEPTRPSEELSLQLSYYLPPTEKRSREPIPSRKRVHRSTSTASNRKKNKPVPSRKRLHRSTDTPSNPKKRKENPIPDLLNVTSDGWHTDPHADTSRCTSTPVQPLQTPDA